MHRTPLTLLRRGARAKISVAAVVATFKKKRLPRTPKTIYAFELGQFAESTDRFIEIYAAAVGASVPQVREALDATHRWRRRFYKEHKAA